MDFSTIHKVTLRRSDPAMTTPVKGSWQSKYDFTNLMRVASESGNFTFAFRCSSFVGGPKNRKNGLNTVVEGCEITRTVRAGIGKTTEIVFEVEEEGGEGDGVESNLIEHVVTVEESRGETKAIGRRDAPPLPTRHAPPIGKRDAQILQIMEKKRGAKERFWDWLRRRRRMRPRIRQLRTRRRWRSS